MFTSTPRRPTGPALALVLATLGGCTETVGPAAPEPRADLIPMAASMTVTSTADQGVGTLRHALDNVDDGGVIQFDPALAGSTIVVATPLRITKSMNIQGPPGGITVSGGNATRVFEVDGFVNTAIFDMTVSGGNATVVPDDGEGGGGFLVTSEAFLQLIRVTVSGNTAIRGGGILARDGGQIAVSHSTISGNTALGDGGGILYDGGTGGGTLIDHSTITGNVAYGAGGGMALERSLFLTYSTVAFNTAHGDAGGIDFRTTLTVVQASVLAHNTNASGAGTTNCSADVGFGTIEGSANISNDASCGVLVATVADPRLGPLAHNGGPTMTHALLAGSPAIDAVAASDELCDPLLTDQRGVSRPQGGGCDLGAFELTAADLLDQLIAISAATAGVPKGTHSKLLDAREHLERGQIGPACNRLKQYIDDVRSQSGKKIAAADADALIALATEVRAGIGC